MGIAGCFDVWIGHFSLKYPSLLSFDRASHNDTTMRERLDKVDPFLLRGSFRKVFASLQRDKGLEQFIYLGHYLLSVDGTGYFSSSKVHCDQCCKKHHRNFSITRGNSRSFGNNIRQRRNGFVANTQAIG